MAQNAGVDYDQAAGSYAAHRRLHGGVFRELCARGGAAVLEVGCGTGNYIRALAAYTGCRACGLDPSAGMLAHAAAQPEPVGWLAARAEQLALAGSTFDLLFSVDVIHHVADKAAYFCEAARLLRPGGQVCTVTDSEDIIRRREILSGYFPDTVAVELARYPRVPDLQRWMAGAGLAPTAAAVVEEPYELVSARPFRDRAYSSLHLIATDAWLAGLERLERDLARGPVRGTSRYVCVWGRLEP